MEHSPPLPPPLPPLCICAATAAAPKFIGTTASRYQPASPPPAFTVTSLSRHQPPPSFAATTTATAPSEPISHFCPLLRLEASVCTGKLPPPYNL